MFIVTVSDPTIRNNSGTSRRTGKPYSINFQPALVELPSGERRKVELQHEDGDAPLAPGQYQPKAGAGYVDKDGKLIVSTRARHWEPVVAKPAAKAA